MKHFVHFNLTITLWFAFYGILYCTNEEIEAGEIINILPKVTGLISDGARIRT